MIADIRIHLGEGLAPAEFQVDAKESPLWWQEKGLQFTASGYGARIPTRYLARYMGKWRRVYCYCYSNSGTCFIGKSLADGLVVSDIYRKES